VNNYRRVLQRFKLFKKWQHCTEDILNMIIIRSSNHSNMQNIA
jgi:hypothetical protein